MMVLVAFLSKIEVPTFAQYLRLQREEFGLTLDSWDGEKGTAVFTFEDIDTIRFKVTTDGSHDEVWVDVEASPKDFPDWLREMMDSFRAVLAKWEVSELGEASRTVIVHYSYLPDGVENPDLK